MNNGDYNALIESYMEAAEIAGLNRNDVELAIVNACRFLDRCESCRHSRAPHNAIAIAEEHGRLEIYRRSCSLRRLTGNGCEGWQRLEAPVMEEVVA